MAIKISQLPSTATAVSADIVALVSGGSTKRTTVAALQSGLIGRPLTSTTPTDGQIYRFKESASEWRPGYGAPRDWYDMVEDFGADPTGVASCNAAWLLAMTAVTASEFSGKRLLFPKGTYYFATTPHVTAACIVEGVGGGLPASKIEVADEQDGLFIDIFEGPDGAIGQGCYIKNLWITGRGVTKHSSGNPATETGREDHGIVIKAAATIENCKITNFSGNGIHGRASTDDDPEDDGGRGLGNNNNTQILHCQIGAVDGNGIHVNGIDANNWLILKCDVDDTGGWGIYNAAFLNTTVISCHVNQAAQLDEFRGVTTGPHYSSTNNPSSYFGNYHESSLGISVILAPTIMICGTSGGTLIPGQGSNRFSLGHPTLPDSDALIFQDSSTVWPFTIVNRYGTRAVNIYAGHKPPTRDRNEAYGYTCDDDDNNAFVWTLDDSVAGAWTWKFMYNRVDASTGFAHTAYRHKKGANRVVCQRGVGFGVGTTLGALQDFRTVYMRTAVPTAGAWQRGDLIINASADGKIFGWECTTSGIFAADCTTWAADTAKEFPAFVKPTVANGFSYWMKDNSGDKKTHATTEPTWPSGEGNTVVDDAVTWECAGLSTPVFKTIYISSDPALATLFQSTAVWADDANTSPTAAGVLYRRRRRRVQTTTATANQVLEDGASFGDVDFVLPDNAVTTLEFDITLKKPSTGSGGSIYVKADYIRNSGAPSLIGAEASAGSGANVVTYNLTGSTLDGTTVRLLVNGNGVELQCSPESAETLNWRIIRTQIEGAD